MVEFKELDFKVKVTLGDNGFEFTVVEESSGEHMSGNRESLDKVAGTVGRLIDSRVKRWGTYLTYKE
jgi:hypothetical protein